MLYQLRQARKEIELAQKDISGEMQALRDREEEEEAVTQRRLDEVCISGNLCI